MKSFREQLAERASDDFSLFMRGYDAYFIKSKLFLKSAFMCVHISMYVCVFVRMCMKEQVCVSGFGTGCHPSVCPSAARVCQHTHTQRERE